MTWALADLVAGDRRIRIRAIRQLEARDPHALGGVLRRLLFADDDAMVRAAAARRLATLDEVAVEPWLLAALGDRAPLVRDVIVRGLAVRGGAAARPALRDRVRRDRMWWVRRAAVYALAAVAGGDELAVFEAALADPFWRVRHAAVKVLAVLGRDPDVRAQVLRAPASDALTFLRAGWGPVALEAPARAVAASALPAALLDPDPAVVTARLAHDRAASPRALVELLCDPHVALRTLAAERIAASGDAAAYRAALDWLEEPRIPHVADTVERMLDDLGDPAAALAGEALTRVDRPGGARWAIAWVVATRFEALYDAARSCARGDARVRDVALAIADDDELVDWAAEASVRDATDGASDDALRGAIAAELHGRAAYDALLALAPDRPRVRALQIDAAAQRGSWSQVEAALADPHPGPRAVATRWWIRDGRAATALAHDPDPAVREAAVCAETAPLLIDDRDPFVARAAIELLVTAFAHDPAPPDAVVAATVCALGSRDPWVRAQACRMAILDATLGLVVAQLADPDDGVRSAAHDALARGGELDARLTRLLDDDRLSAPGRAMAHAWLARALDDAAVEHAITALPREQDSARRVLAAVAGVELAPPAITASPATPPRAPPIVEHRPLPRAGFAIAPLVISGAFDLSPEALALAADAGVDTYFWEPGYDSLTEHLRAHRTARVVTGSYHADAASIEADVDRALRRLGRSALDVFLLFWSRSPARVDPAAFTVLDRLKRAGKLRAIGFSTHHRELARDAISASPWDVVMIRHSAAHPGIESELLPVARRTNTAILTFSALCYGRMVSGACAPSPADCYRYSLAQPGVVGCISAPRRRHELIENLAALRRPSLDDAELATLRAHGVGVRAENQRFNTLMRQPTRDAAAAARELLASELPPTDELSAASQPRAATSRGTRSRIGTVRRRR